MKSRADTKLTQVGFYPGVLFTIVLPSCRNDLGFLIQLHSRGVWGERQPSPMWGEKNPTVGSKQTQTPQNPGTIFPLESLRRFTPKPETPPFGGTVVLYPQWVSLSSHAGHTSAVWKPWDSVYCFLPVDRPHAAVVRNK